MRTRHQTGQIIERSGVFYVRYYRTKLSDEKVKRERVTQPLCSKDAKHHSLTCPAVKRLRDEFMVKINRDAGAPVRTNAPDITVVEYWDNTYLPWLERERKASTAFGYKKLWEAVLEPHFKRRTLRDYRVADGSQWLTELARGTFGRRSIQHVRSLASGIFSHALNSGALEGDRNVWREVKVLTKVREPEATAHYSLPQARQIINALADRVDAQAAFSLAFFLGLRPSEIAGLRWEDLDGEWINVKRAAVRGVVGDPKTKESKARLPLIQPVRGMLESWRKKCQGVTAGWVFPKRDNGPLHVESLCRHVIKPACDLAGVEWHGLYAARRGCATRLAAITGGSLASSAVLRHKPFSNTAVEHYIKQMAEAGDDSLRQFEQEALEGWTTDGQYTVN